MSFINKQKALIANRNNSNPSEKIKVIGVTGIKGKTTVTHVLHHILKNSNLKVGYISSFGNSINGDTIDIKNNANKLKAGDAHNILAQMVKNGLDYAILELTSQNIKDNIFEGIHFDSGIITNISLQKNEDENFLHNIIQEKIDFINKINTEGLLVLQHNDTNASNLLLEKSNLIKNNIYINWTHNNTAKSLSFANDSTRFVLDNENYYIPLIGLYNLSNTIQSIRLAKRYVSALNIKNSLINITSPVYSMHLFSKQPYTIFIDNSKTSEEMEIALKHLKLIKPTNSKIITVCGGVGEEHKSYLNIGKITSTYSNIIMLVANDPYSEKVSDINTIIENNAKEANGVVLERIGSDEEYRLINKNNLKNKIQRINQNGDAALIAFDADDFSSRLDGIDLALKMASYGDIIYIAGKGNENSLIFNSVEYQWSDEEAVKKCLTL